MQNLTIPQKAPIELSFKVGIAGTSSKPSKVMVVLERDGQATSFTAIEDGDNWRAKIENLDLYPAGPVNFSVQVLLGSKLFVPMRVSAEIVGDSVTPMAPPAPSEPMIVPDQFENVLPPIVAPTVEAVKPQPVKPVPPEVQKSVPTPIKALIKEMQKPLADDSTKTAPQLIQPVVIRPARKFAPSGSSVNESLKFPKAEAAPVIALNKTHVILK